jgi:hypothetical protein
MKLTFANAPRASAAAAALALAAALSAPAQQRPQQTDRDRDELVGQVKTVAVSAAGPADPSPVPVETSTYTPDGDLVERVFYVDGREAARVEFRADAEGFVHATATTPAGMGYGVRGTRLQPLEQPAVPFVAAADGRYAFVIGRAYDSAGRLLNETTYPGDDPKKVGPPLSRLVYKYDAAQGRLQDLTRFYGQPGVPVEKESFTYDEGGRVRESVHYRQNNLLPARRTYAYETDARGNWTKRTETERLGKASVVTVTTRAITYY